jgi:TRAP-type transport system periplasmic protein
MASIITRRTFLASATVLGVVAPRLVHAAPRVIRIGHNNADNSHFDQGCKVFAAAVAADPTLSPVLRIEVHGNSELGDELAMQKACMDGTLDMAMTSTATLGNIVPEVALMDTPFLFKTVAIARAALDGATGAEFAELMKAKGLNVLAWGENGLRQITANRPIRTPADLHGLKIRVPQSDVELASFRALGADPGPLAYGELYEALRTGRFDAEENPISVIEAAKLQGVQKYLSLTGHIYSPITLLASSDLLEDLTPPQRAALITCGKQGAARTRVVAETAQRDGVGRLTAAGMVLVQDVDIPAFVAAARPNMEVLGQKYGADRMQRLIAAGA